MVCVRGGGGQSSGCKIYLKLKATVQIRLILSPVSFRLIPWNSSDYRLLIYCWDLDVVVCGVWGRMPSFLIRYLHRVEVFGSEYPNFSFRQLPTAAVDFRGLPPPHILLGFRQHGLWGVGPEAKVHDPIFT